MNAPFIVPTITSAPCPFDALLAARFAVAFFGCRVREGAGFLEVLLRFLAADLPRVDFTVQISQFDRTIPPPAGRDSG
jgi:hypothetical protein